MKVAVLGATGRTGRLVVDQAVELGHQVRALVRTPGRLAPQRGVEWVQGDATDAAAVRAVLKGCEAAISTLAPTADSPWACSLATAHVLAAMKPLGVRRYVAVCGAGVGLPGDAQEPSGRFAARLTRVLARQPANDKEKEVALLLASDADWVLLRAPELVDGPAGQRLSSLLKPPGSKISRVDLATFLLEQLTDARHLRRGPWVASR